MPDSDKTGQSNPNEMGQAMPDSDKPTSRIKILVLALTLVSMGVIVGLLLSTTLPDGVPRSNVSIATPHAADPAIVEPGSGKSPVPSALIAPPPPHSAPLASPFVEVAARVVPAVVSVESRRTVSQTHLRRTPDDLFHRFFPDSEDEDGGVEIPSSGSGFFIDPEGYLFTNDHVVSGAEALTVHLADGRSYPAWLVGTDPGTDVAVVKVELPPGDPPLPSVPLGNSEEIRVGDWAIAIGNPLGELQGTLTVGIISAKGRRDLRIAGGGPLYQDFIQTDASINFGNSGGPLVNTRGEVIGINSAINPTGQGLGFTIPINMARRIGLELIRSGTIHRGYLGIRPQEVTGEIREAWGMPHLEGILVSSVESETPAKRGGLRVGDVILEFDGRSVGDVPEFRAMVAEVGVGVNVPIRLLRDRKERTLDVLLVERPDTPEPPSDRPETEDDRVWPGVTLEDNSSSLAEVYELLMEDGVVVTGVERGGAARRGGLREGDVILEVNRNPVETRRQIEGQVAIARRQEKPLVFLVRRGETTTFVTVKFKR